MKGSPASFHPPIITPQARRSYLPLLLHYWHLFLTG